MPILRADSPVSDDAPAGDVVRTLTLDRPEALNALTPELLGELADELQIAAEDRSVRVVVLTGTGRAFSAGVDLKALAARPVTGGNVSLDLNTPAPPVHRTPVNHAESHDRQGERLLLHRRP